MKLIKVFGLAAVAAVAAMAFIGTSAAMAVEHADITLCKTLVTGENLCPNGDLLPKGVTLIALAKEPVLKNSLATVRCEDSIIKGKTLTEIGPTLSAELTSVEFGKLPTPSLGTGCETCIGGVHTTPPYAATVSVAAKDDFFLTSSGSATLLNCFGLGINCTYGSNSIKSLVDRDPGNTHGLALTADQKVYALILINAPLERKAGSSGFCPATGTWEASYSVVHCILPDGVTTTPCWLALDDLI